MLLDGQWDMVVPVDRSISSSLSEKWIPWASNTSSPMSPHFFASTAVLHFLFPADVMEDLATNDIR